MADQIPDHAEAAVLLRTVSVYRAAALAGVVDPMIQGRPEAFQAVAMDP